MLLDNPRFIAKFRSERPTRQKRGFRTCQECGKPSPLQAIRAIFTYGAANQYGYVALYLHGVHLNRLDDKPAFMAEFDRHGLAVVAPQPSEAGGPTKSAASSIQRFRPNGTSSKTCCRSSKLGWAQSLRESAS